MSKINYLHLFMDSIGLAKEGIKDYDAAIHGKPYDLTELSKDLLKEIGDVGIVSPDWLTPEVVEQALSIAFEFIRSKKPL